MNLTDLKKYLDCHLKGDNLQENSIMARQKPTRRQKDISRLLREKKYNPPKKSKKNNPFPSKKHGR